MEYWRGIMDWPLKKGWRCLTCNGDRLEWGFAHAQCRCNECHTQFRMRNEKKEIVDVPLCQLRDKYKEPAKLAWAKWHIPVDELTDEQGEEFMTKKEEEK